MLLSETQSAAGPEEDEHMPTKDTTSSLPEKVSTHIFV